MMNKVLITILLLAAALRLFGLGSMPASLYWEETALGYDAYSIWKTGKDFHGTPLPVIAFTSFGDYKASGYFYLAAPFVGLLGLTNWSIRLPSALAGIVTVYLVYLLGTFLFKKREVGLLAAFVLAIMPWHIQFSRAAFEVNVATMWLTWGTYLLFLTRKKAVWILPAGLMFVASVYTYQSARVLAPLIGLLALCFVTKKLFRSGWFWMTGFLCLGLMLPMLIHIKDPIVSQRFAETSLFSTSPAVAETNGLRLADGNTPLSRIIHHRYLVWGKEIVGGMVSHFSPQFLFSVGDGNQRHQTGYTALLYWWCIIPLTLGLLSNAAWFPIGWIILATIPPALTNLTPHTLRFLPASPAFALLIGWGLWRLVNLKKPIVLVAILFLIAGELTAYGFDYMTSYTKRSSADWQYGYEQVIQFIKDRNKPTEMVQVTRNYGRPSMYFLYYLQYDPRLIQAAEPSLPKDQGELLAFDRYRFGDIDLSKPGLAVSAVPLSKGILLKKIDFLDARSAFYIYEL